MRWVDWWVRSEIACDLSLFFLNGAGAASRNVVWNVRQNIQQFEKWMKNQLSRCEMLLDYTLRPVADSPQAITASVDAMARSEIPSRNKKRESTEREMRVLIYTHSSYDLVAIENCLLRTRYSRVWGILSTQSTAKQSGRKSRQNYKFNSLDEARRAVKCVNKNSQMALFCVEQ